MNAFTCAWMVAGLVGCPSLVVGQWTMFSGDGERSSRTPVAPSSLSAPDWVCSMTQGGQPVTFNGPAGVVIHDGVVFGQAEIGGVDHGVGVDLATGNVLWATRIPGADLSSWSTPAVEPVTGVVLFATGPFLTALDASTGAQRWQTPLARSVVNASPAVTSDPGSARNRAFITDYDGVGREGRLYCINTDARHPTLNPFDPGDVVWSVVLGATSGNTPACSGGRVWVSAVSTDNTGSPLPGIIRCYPANTDTPPAPVWETLNPATLGFFSGVSVRDDGVGRWVYAASYSFTGGMDSANLLKLNADTGAVVWSTPSNRTSATPIAVDDGRIFLSTGVRGFGSAPSIQGFIDHGGSAQRSWDTALDTWQDRNTNGRLDPGEYMAVGGWLHQPVVAIGPEGVRVIAGVLSLSGGQYTPGTDIRVLDPAFAPSDPRFVVERFTGAGSTPAVDRASGATVLVGPAGLHAFGVQAACMADCDQTTGLRVLDIFDFLCFQNRFAGGDPYACECDATTGPNVCDVFDFLCFQNAFAQGCP